MPATVDDHTVGHECLNEFCLTADLANGPGIFFAVCRFYCKELASRLARVYFIPCRAVCKPPIEWYAKLPVPHSASEGGLPTRRGIANTTFVYAG